MPSMATENSDVSKAKQIKLQANEAFKAHKYAHAIDLYTQAIKLNSENAVYLANRTLAHTKLEEYGSAIHDASKAVEIDPTYSKGFYRRGAAYLAMGKFKDNYDRQKPYKFQKARTWTPLLRSTIIATAIIMKTKSVLIDSKLAKTSKLKNKA